MVRLRVTPPNRQPTNISKMKRWWKDHWRQGAGVLSFAIGFLVTVIIAMGASAKNPPSAAESVAYVVIAALFQGGSVYLFSRSGKPDGVHASAAVRRLVRLAERAGEMRSVALHSARDDTPAESKRKMGIIAAQLEYLAYDGLDSIEDWTSFNADARAKVDEIQKEL